MGNHSTMGYLKRPPCEFAESLGNHEFDDGPSGLVPFIENISIPVLACNLNITRVPSLNIPNLRKSIVFNYTGGFKVGIVGYVTPETKVVSKPGDVEFLEEVSSIQEEVDKLHKEGVNFLIALGHSGYPKDLEIAEKVKGAHLVIGGHTNTFLYTGQQPSNEQIKGPYPTVVTQENGDKVLVVQAYAYTKYLGVLDIDFNVENGSISSYKGNPILLDNFFEDDPEISRNLQIWKKEIDVKGQEKVGLTKVFLDGGELVRHGESNLGNLITDAYIDYNVKRYTGLNGWTDSPIAIIQGGGIRGSISVSSTGGVVTYLDVLTTLPFEDPLCRVVLKGSHLLEALEWSVKSYDSFSNLDKTFLQVSGLFVEYDLSGKPGKRVVKALARCSNCSVPQYYPIVQEEEYAILMSEYLADGGDGYSMFKNDRLSIIHYRDRDTEIVKEYINKTSPIHPGIESRIVLINIPPPQTAIHNNDCTNLNSPILIYVTISIFYLFA